MTTSPRTATRVMRARHPGECPACGRYYGVGTQIAKFSGIWVCAQCVIRYQRDHPDVPAAGGAAQKGTTP